MRWKDGVCVNKEPEYSVRLRNKEMLVADNVRYIAMAIENGDTNIEELEKIIMQYDQCDALCARLTLGQFIVDYGEFINGGDSYYKID